MSLVVHDVIKGSLVQLSPQQYRVPLPRLEPGATLQMRLWARSRVAGSAVAAAVVLCPAPVTATLGLTFDEPFELKCRLSSEAAVHTLTLPKIAGHEIGTTALTIGQPALVTAMVRLVQPGALVLEDASVHADPASGLMVVADVRNQLQAQAAARSSGGVGEQALTKGDVYTLVLPVCPTKLSEVRLASPCDPN